MPRLTGSQLNINSIDDAKRAIKALSDNVPSPELNTIQTSGDGGIGELQTGGQRRPPIIDRNRFIAIAQPLRPRRRPRFPV